MSYGSFKDNDIEEKQLLIYSDQDTFINND